MNIFPHFDRAVAPGNLPVALLGRWRLGVREYEIKSDNCYYVLESDLPYELLNGGMILDFNGDRYLRKYGNSGKIQGVWQLEADPSAEYYFRENGTFTFHTAQFEYFGEYTHTNQTVDMQEMRAALSEANGVLTFSPPYQLNFSAAWSLDEPELTIHFPSGTAVYTRT